MGLRSVKRQIARARLTVMGVGNVNRKMRLKKDSTPNWVLAISGKTGEEAHRAQMNYGRLLKAREQGKAVTSRRKVKKV